MRNAAEIEPIGVYRVSEAEQPAYLVELWVRGYKDKLDFGKFSQRIEGLDPSQEQVAYLEHSLSDDGASGTWLPMEPQAFDRDIRVAFFLHFLDTERPLNAPFGPVFLPSPTERPGRLSFIEYFEP
jgi:hypothetical protein